MMVESIEMEVLRSTHFPGSIERAILAIVHDKVIYEQWGTTCKNHDTNSVATVAQGFEAVAFGSAARCHSCRGAATGAMLGAPYVRYDTAVDNIELWTESAVEDLIKGCKKNNREDQGMFMMIVESHNRRILEKVASYLGEEEDTTGGTMGAPRTPPAWMKILNARLSGALIAQQDFYVEHMFVFSVDFLHQNFWQKYLWRLLNFHDG